jgi:glycosyltransferase involved in cell wall biosynthesis
MAAGAPADTAPMSPAPLTLTPRAVAVPCALGLPAVNARFSPGEMARKLNVLFIVSQPTSSPAISVHADLMKFLDRDRVGVHVLYNRLADGEAYRSGGGSVLDVLPQTPDVCLLPVELGPVGGAARHRLIAGSIAALAPAVRDWVGVVRYIRRNRIDVIHCEEGTRNGFYAYLLARRTGAKCIMHFHWKYGSWMSPLSRFAVRQADAIITVSSWTGRVIEQAGVSPQRIFPVLNGIDVAAWDPATVDGDAVRRELGIRPQDPLVVMVAQLTAWKRQTAMVEAFRRVVTERPNARLLLVGAELNPGTVPGASYTDALRRLIADAGLERNVLLAGRRRDVRQILAASDIFALPSVDDPCALALIEAMAMAKPIVAVTAGGAPELVAHGRSGLLAAPDDAAGLAAHILTLIDDPIRRRELGANGRRSVLEHLNAQRMADEVEAVYRLTSGTAAP